MERLYILFYQMSIGKYSGFRSYEVHHSPLSKSGVGGGVLIPHNTKEVLYFELFTLNYLAITV
jgi:hypothetical protein